MAREIELKFDVEPGGAQRVRDASALAAAHPARAEHRSHYFDTSKGVLRSAGFSLRIRQSGDRFVQTVKQQGATAAGLFDRGEWETMLAGPELDLGALDATPLGPLLSSKQRARLRPVIGTDFSRTLWAIGGIEAALDEGAVSSGRKRSDLIELELELKDGEASNLFDLAGAIAKRAPLRLGVLSKVERGTFLAEGRLGKIVKAEAVTLDPGMTAADGFAAIAHACLRHYRLNEMVLLDHDDAAALHQARVAMRRLRSALSLFGGVIRDGELGRLKEELRWYTGQFGDARNLDVFIRRLPEAAAKERAGAAVRKTLNRARREAYARAFDAMRSERQRMLMVHLVRWIEIGDWRQKGKAKRPLVGLAAKRLDRRWHKVEEPGAVLAALAPEPRHRLRIDIKKMRYAAEFLSSLYEDERAAARRIAFVDALEALQDHLGDLNDADTARAILADLPISGAEEKAFAETLIGREPDHAKCIAAAEAAYRALKEAGTFWRA